MGMYYEEKNVGCYNPPFKCILEANNWDTINLVLNSFISTLIFLFGFLHDDILAIHNVTLLQYRIGQLYMIAKHSHEQSEHGEGVEVVKNEDCEHPKHGKGRFTEKRVYLSR